MKKVFIDEPITYLALGVVIVLLGIDIQKPATKMSFMVLYLTWKLIKIELI